MKRRKNGLSSLILNQFLIEFKGEEKQNEVL